MPSKANEKRKILKKKDDDDDDDDEDNKEEEKENEKEASEEEAESDASSDASDSEDNDVVGKLNEAKAQQDKQEKEEDEQDEEQQELMAAKRRKKSATGGGKNKSNKATTPAAKKPIRLSAATLKTRMSPAMLQNPIARKKIWANVMQMMIRRGYEWVQDRAPPADHEELWPNNRGFLSIFHMHAADPASVSADLKREPVYVVFCSKAGDPTLKSLQYPSRHIVLVSDSLTGRARGALQQLATKTPPFAHQVTTNTTAIGDKKEEGWPLKDVFVEAFVSTSFMFDLLKQRYLKIVQFETVSAAELEKVYDVFERKRDLNHFPKMLDTDPVVRHLRLPVGSVMKTTRLSTLAALHNAYRVIVRATPETKSS